MNVDATTASSIAQIFGCATAGFPQTYLGLPLSPTKLPPSAFQPLISSFRSLLPGWCVKLLNRAGRLVLISAVLDSFSTYFLSVFKIPKKTLKTLDAIRRAFFWAAEETCTGSKCLIAWKNVCKPNFFGGLGIKNLAIQNECLLMKFAFKYLTHDENTQLPWISWLDKQHLCSLSHLASCQNLLS